MVSSVLIKESEKLIKAIVAIIQTPKIWPELIPYPKTITLKIKLIFFCKVQIKNPSDNTKLLIK